jgi:hypothetical protein
MTDIFDKDAARAARDTAMDAIESNTSQAWRDAMMAITVEVAKLREFFTSDAVFYIASKRNMPFIHDRRAYGPVIQQARRDGVCKKTERTVQCRRVSRHAGLLTVWQSLIFVRKD